NTWNKYTGVITPPEGTHVLYYFAKDHLGSEELPKSLVFKLDATPPVIMNLNIKEGMYVNTESIEITGNISEPLSVLLIQGKRVPIGSSGFFKTDVSLNEGTNTISFVVIDVAGNRSFRGVKVIRDTIPPDIEIEYPSPWITVHTKVIEVKGKTEPGVELKVNGKSITVREDGRFVGEIKLNRSGTNALEFVVKDKAGNITRESVAVILILKVRIELFIGKREAFVNDMRKMLDYPPFIHKGRTMVPLRFISEGFGADVEWDPVVRVATITFSNEKEVVMKVSPDSNVASLNGKPYIMDVEPVIKEGRIFVPIRFVAEAFGSDVKWFLEERKVVIIYPRGG
ncbi:MAG TPA: copper amine oxidase N-terminal domain-containing protein, partial [Candidatus Aerophobetes bacterium]|nr:copper amine oxidase N-terminal domain-containing protein [Candidatus Aerophobetes bacterium]